jgi:hypothetical protein
VYILIYSDLLLLLLLLLCLCALSHKLMGLFLLQHFIIEAETLLASPKSPDGGPFAGNTPGVIGAQEVYK